MILKALYDYYHRSGDLPPMGFEKVPITFIIVIDDNGKFCNIEDTREGKNPKSFIVPKGVQRSVNISANSLWDNGEYVLGIPKGDKEKDILNAQKRNFAFKEKCLSFLSELPQSTELQAIKLFYENNEVENVIQSEYRDAIMKDSVKNFTFQIMHSMEIVPQVDSVKQLFLKTEVDSGDDNSTDSPICLVTGKRGEIVRLTTRTPIAGSQATASLVSFQKSSGYDSYGKEQCSNAPIGVEAESAYVGALQKLLAKDSRNKFLLASRTFVFWASGNNDIVNEIENDFFAFLAPVDNPDRNILKVEESFKSIFSGIKRADDKDRFYMLALAPNSARIAVVYWNECTVKEFAEKILRHFDDMEIIDGRKDPKPYQGIYQMLSAVTLGGKVSDAQPNLPESILKSIIEGTPYPFTLYSSCIRRLNAEAGEDYFSSNVTRFAIIKAYLNRNTNEKPINIMLDKENTNKGYLCGRLFATLEKIQEDANNMHSIRERYMTAASTTPSTVFGTLLNLSNHHAEKLNEGARISFEKTKQEIIDKLDADGFPSNLDLNDQGRFFVGYYHQRQSFFTKKEDNQ